MTIDRNSWGFRRNADISDYLEPSDLITTLVETVRCAFQHVVLFCTSYVVIQSVTASAKRDSAQDL